MKPEEQLEEVKIEKEPDKLDKLKELINRMQILEQTMEKVCEKRVKKKARTG